MLAVSALVLVMAGWWTNWDLALADAAFDRHARVFSLRHAWFAETLNHTILKRASIAFGSAAVLLALRDAWSPFGWPWLVRFRLRVLALSAVLVPALTSTLKQMSNAHCPWDLARYGGTEPYIRLFEALPAGVAAGHCLPAGHASSALWLISLCVFFLPGSLARAALTLAALLGFGMTVGWIQQLRGAHFLTHTLWSMWIAVATVMVIVTLLDRCPGTRAQATAQIH